MNLVNLSFSTTTSGSIVSLIPGLVSVVINLQQFLDSAQCELGCRYLSSLGLGTIAYLICNSERFSSIVFGIQK